MKLIITKELSEFSSSAEEPVRNIHKCLATEVPLLTEAQLDAWQNVWIITREHQPS
jgi:hypothetical protein